MKKTIAAITAGLLLVAGQAVAQNNSATVRVGDRVGAEAGASSEFAGVPIAVLFVGLFTWGAGKLVGAKATLGAATVIATYSYFPRLLELLVSGAQVLLLPEEQITGRASVSLGAARALDPDTASTALMAVLMRVDVFTLWVTFLIAVGLRVVGKVPMSKALVAAGVVWVLGGLFTFLTSGLAG